MDMNFEVLNLSGYTQCWALDGLRGSSWTLWPVTITLLLNCACLALQSAKKESDSYSSVMLFVYLSEANEVLILHWLLRQGFN